VCGRIYVTNNNALGPGGYNQNFFYDDRTGDGTDYFKVSLRTGVGAGVLVVSRSGSGVYTAVNTIASNTWYDFEFTDTGGSTPTQTLYINGAAVSTTVLTGDASGDVIASSIGSGTSSLGNLAGRESDLSVYNRVLSASEATQFHLVTDPTNGLIHAWEMDDSHVSGTTITDTATVTSGAPVLSNVAASASYSAGATATTLSSGTRVSDPESANLVSGTVSISSGTFLTGDTLAAVTTGTSITASYNTSTGVLSLTGSDTLAHYQQVLDSVSYSSSSQNPTNSGADPSRPVSWVVNDGTLNSATQTTTINITGGTPSGADTGTAHGGVASVTGPNPPATARSFDGVAGSYISLASSPFDWNSGPFSVCGRIYVTNNNVLGPGGFNQHFFYDDRAGNGTDYMKVSLRTVVGAGVLTFSRSGHGFYTAVNTIANNTWLDFEFTDSGGSTPTQTLYINGAVVSTTSIAGDLSGDVVASSIGTGTSSAGNLAGRESDLRVYNRVLGAGEASQFHLATDPTN
jgi:hypothetical protein